MEIFDTINQYLMTHPNVLATLEAAFRLKFWIFLALAVYFVSLPYRQYRKDLILQDELAAEDGHFLA